MKSATQLQKDFAKSVYFDLLPCDYVKGYMDGNTNTSYISLEDGLYIYHSNNCSQQLERFNNYNFEYDTLEDLEKALINFEVLDDDCYEITEEQYIMFSNIHNLKEQ
jgi:hypothetical protein